MRLTNLWHLSTVINQSNVAQQGQTFIIGSQCSGCSAPPAVLECASLGFSIGQSMQPTLYFLLQGLLRCEKKVLYSLFKCSGVNVICSQQNDSSEAQILKTILLYSTYIKFFTNLLS